MQTNRLSRKQNSKYCNIVFIAQIYFIIAFSSLKYLAPLGIDIERYYDSVRYGIDEWTAYYLKEFVSWGLLSIASSFYEGKSANLLLIFVDLMLWSIFVIFTPRKLVDPRFYFLVLLYPTFILLGFNVIRQYVAVIFFSVALFNIFAGRKKIFLLFSIFSFFSHNGITPIILATAIFFIYDSNKKFGIFLMVFSFFLFFGLFSIDFFNESLTRNADALEDGIDKLALYFFFAILCLICIIIKFRSLDKDSFSDVRNRIYRYSLFIFFFCLMLSSLPLPIWMINRIWISAISLYCVLFMCTKMRFRAGAGGLQQLAFAAMNFVVLAAHPGARSMLIG